MSNEKLEALMWNEEDDSPVWVTELKELRAYRRAWERWLELNAPFARNAGERILREELARKGTP